MTENWTVGRIIEWTAQYFGVSGITEARLDAETLLADVLGCPRLQLNLMTDKVIPAKELAKFRGMVLERKARKPVSYILGEREFMGLKFKVGPATLIPRPETELLVEETAKIAHENGSKVIMEIGTGSGNIAVALAVFSEAERIFSSDLSIEALRVAQSNIDANGVSARVTLRQGDVFEAFKGESLESAVDIIVSNPPYVAESERDMLLPELSFEPESALFGGGDGLDFYKEIAAGAGKYLKKNGFLAFEMNSNKSVEIQKIVADAGFKIERIINDYSSLERIII